ncbi:thiamine pyrophosphate-requiring protein [Adhaeribacter radiodurans]|uniref:Thiamine pyrophosphate-requiring protein n=1 Tax=Adhaeribacter radiodurans TaxID=2745197 RepID=A0A7L7L5K5_9BACT|nr:thiamine pyrophosphate-requiring protein [Adhaeribacter radiodurans]QMU28050.1 thiamine pyrophosphate-requiring protein [Adhaeribacter radiodurans]
MKENVSDFLVKRLQAWGVKRIFGYPGDGINGIMGALNRASETIDFVQVRHEEMASLMACAHAKFTKQVGVCLATSGPGAIHLLNGLYDAKLDHQPVVAIVGQKALKSLGGNSQQEIDLMSLFKDVASEYIQMAVDPAQIRHLIDRAFRIALSQRTVTCIIIPNDLQTKEYENPPHEHQTIHSGVGFSAPRVIPQKNDLLRAAEIINDGKRVAILVGSGAIHAAEEVKQVADLLGAGVAKAFLGKAALPDDLPYVTGAIGLFGSNASHYMMQNCDTLLMIGSSFPYAEFLPEEGKARGIQIELDGRMQSIRYPMEVNLTGDSAETLQALLPLLNKKTDRTWQQQIEQQVKDWWNLVQEYASHPANPVNPRLLFQELSPRLPDNCILASDSGSSSSWTAQHIRIREGMQFSVSGTLATMGCAVPYAIAAKFAHPNRAVFAFVGDGAMQMGGNDELLTIQKYWRHWQNPQLIVLVLNNRDLNFVTWEQRLMQGEPKFDDSQVLPDFNYAQYAENIGLIGIRVEQPDQVIPALEKALQADRPVVIDALTDPEILVFTPQVATKFASELAEAINKGDTAAQQHLEEPLRHAVQEEIKKEKE